LNKIIAGSKGGYDVCVGMMRQIDSAESTTNSATSFGADRVTTITFQQAADAVTFSIAPASQWASCKSDNQEIRVSFR